MVPISDVYGVKMGAETPNTRLPSYLYRLPCNIFISTAPDEMSGAMHQTRQCRAADVLSSLTCGGGRQSQQQSQQSEQQQERRLAAAALHGDRAAEPGASSAALLARPADRPACRRYRGRPSIADRHDT